MHGHDNPAIIISYDGHIVPPVILLVPHIHEQVTHILLQQQYNKLQHIVPPVTLLLVRALYDAQSAHDDRSRQSLCFNLGSHQSVSYMYNNYKYFSSIAIHL